MIASMETTKKKGISEAVLKNIAVFTMTIDHVTAFILKAYLRTQGVVNFYSNTWYTVGRDIGRIAFVLYAFMVAEGAFRTRNKKKYALRLIALAVISVIPYLYAHDPWGGHPFALLRKHHDMIFSNIFFLLFLGLLTVYAWDWLKARMDSSALSVILRLLVLCASCALSELGKLEYGLMGILLIAVFHIFRYERGKMFFAAFLVMTAGYIAHSLAGTDVVQWFANHQTTWVESLMRLDNVQVFGLLAFPFLLFYNGRKGRQLSKWFYYMYYPVHLGIIALILTAM